MDTRLAALLIRHCDVGVTLDLDGSTVTEGYAVGRENWEMRLAYGGQSEGVVRAWVDYVLAVHADLYADSEWALGVWRDGARVYFDVVNVVADRDEAMSMGRAHNQLAIFDLAKGEEIRLDGPLPLGPCEGCNAENLNDCRGCGPVEPEPAERECPKNLPTCLAHCGEPCKPAADPCEDCGYTYDRETQPKPIPGGLCERCKDYEPADRRGDCSQPCTDCRLVCVDRSNRGD